MTERPEIESLAEALSWTSGEMTRWSETAHPDHNRWSWRGDGHGDALRDHFREQAQALIELGWTRDLPPEESVPEMLARVAAEEEAHADDTDRPHYRNRVTPPADSDDVCWCDGLDCGQTPCVEAQGSSRVLPPGAGEANA